MSVEENESIEKADGTEATAPPDEPSVFGVEPPHGSFYFARDLVAARKQRNRRAGGVVRDYFRICWNKRRLINPEHYFKFRLYECESDLAKRMHDYIDPVDRRALNVAINRFAQADGIFSQKLYFEALLRRFGVATTRTLGVVVRPGNSFEGSIGTTDELAAMLGKARFPIFGKPINGSLSRGVVVIEAYDGVSGSLRLHGGADVAATSFLAQVQKEFGEYGYLLQEKLEPHASMRSICGDAIGSVRMVTLSEEGETRPLYALWKIPSIGAVADNFWRSGNVVAHLDVDTGRVLACQLGSGTQGRPIERHPETGEPLVGFTLPHWQATRALAIEGASVFYSVGVIGWDIAVTNEGPVLIEGNNNPDHGMLQTAADRGLYSTEAGQALAAARRRGDARLVERNRETKANRRALLRARRMQTLGQGFKTRGIDGDAT